MFSTAYKTITQKNRIIEEWLSVELTEDEILVGVPNDYDKLIILSIWIEQIIDDLEPIKNFYKSKLSEQEFTDLMKVLESILSMVQISLINELKKFKELKEGDTDVQ